MGKYIDGTPRIISVTIGHSHIKLGASYKSLKQALKGHKIEKKRTKGTFLVWAYINGDYYVFYFKIVAGEEILDDIFVTGGY